MGRVYFTTFTLMTLSHLLCVSSIELVANYKFWDSVSDQIVFDASGNSRHGEWLDPNFHITDRGVDYAYFRGMSLTSIPVQGYSDFALSFWALRVNGVGGIFCQISDGDGKSNFDVIEYSITDSSTGISYNEEPSPPSLPVYIRVESIYNQILL